MSRNLIVLKNSSGRILHATPEAHLPRSRHRISRIHHAQPFSASLLTGCTSTLKAQPKRFAHCLAQQSRHAPIRDEGEHPVPASFQIFCEDVPVSSIRGDQIRDGLNGGRTDGAERKGFDGVAGILVWLELIWIFPSSPFELYLGIISSRTDLLARLELEERRPMVGYRASLLVPFVLFVNVSAEMDSCNRSRKIFSLELVGIPLVVYGSSRTYNHLPQGRLGILTAS